MEVFFSATPNGWKLSIMLEELKAAGVPVDWTVVDVNVREPSVPSIAALLVAVCSGAPSVSVLTVRLNMCTAVSLWCL